MSSTYQHTLNLGKCVHFTAFQRKLPAACFVYRQTVFAITWKSKTHVYPLSRKGHFQETQTSKPLKAKSHKTARKLVVLHVSGKYMYGMCFIQ